MLRSSRFARRRWVRSSSPRRSRISPIFCENFGREARQGVFMKVPFRLFLWSACGLAAALLAGGCSSSAPKKEQAAELPVGFHYDQPKAKTDPNIVEETDGYYVRRYKKSEMERVDAKHVRTLILSRVSLPIYREDENYYYVRTEKYSPEELKAATEEHEQKLKEKEERKKQRQRAKEGDTGPVLTERDF